MNYYSAIVMGASAGGLEALKTVFSTLPANYNIPILIVLHRNKGKSSFFCSFFSDHCKLKIFEAEDKMTIKQGYIYIAPPDYHMMIESDRTISLTVDKPENHSRPSIDVLFETAAEVYKKKLVGVIMTGANSDGSIGAGKLKKNGGLLIVQDPETSIAPQMPLSAISAADADYILTPEGVGELLGNIQNMNFHSIGTTDTNR